jgi:hypothetical protein
LITNRICAKHRYGREKFTAERDQEREKVYKREREIWGGEGGMEGEIYGDRKIWGDMGERDTRAKERYKGEREIRGGEIQRKKRDMGERDTGEKERYRGEREMWGEEGKERETEWGTGRDRLRDRKKEGDR